MSGDEMAVDGRRVFAVYSKDDKSLRFYNREAMPEIGEVFEGRTADAVYTEDVFWITEDGRFPWDVHAHDVKAVEVVDEGIAPESTSLWFVGFENMTSCDLSRLDTSRTVDMSWMFEDCKSLADLDLSGIDTSNVRNMNWMFAGCSSLTTLNLSGLDTSKVSNMVEMFWGCSSLSQVDLTGFDAFNVAVMRDMLASCENLQIAGVEKSGQEKRVFAVYSKDDKSLRFYNREAMPEIGEVFEGRTADAVYADVLEAGAYSRIWSDQDRDIADVEFVDEGIGDLLLEKEVESRKLAGSEEGAHASIWVRTLAGVVGGLLLGLLVGTVLQCLR